LKSGTTNWTGQYHTPTLEDWLYLAVTLDLFHRKVIGWSIGRWITRQLVIDALNMAIKSGRLKLGLIHHSGREVQYASNEFQALPKTNRIQCSMSRKGDCWDNAAAESFFHALKVELIHGKLTMSVRKLKRLLLNVLKGSIIGNAAILISAISVPMSMKKRMWLN
jgi:transposase InsO family protein